MHEDKLKLIKKTLMTLTALLIFRNMFTVDQPVVLMPIKGTQEKYCSNHKFEGFQAVMTLLLINHMFGRPKSYKKTHLRIFGFLLINLITFLFATRGVYLIFGNHFDNGPIQKLPGIDLPISGDSSQAQIDTINKNKIPTVSNKNKKYEPSNDSVTSPNDSSGVKESLELKRMKELFKLRREIMIKNL